VFFVQGEDGIRDWSVTGVQTCALPISLNLRAEEPADARQAPYFIDYVAQILQDQGLRDPASRVGIRVFTTLDPLLQARADQTVEIGRASCRERGQTSVGAGGERKRARR